MTEPREHPGPAQVNIERIAEMEKEFLERRSVVERVGDTIADFVGSTTFVILHVIWFTAWIAVNRNLIPQVRTFDPYPFLLLGLAVSLEAVLLSTFVLMKQNRMSKRSDRRNDLNLQIDLLAEREATMMLQMLQQICAHLGLEEVGDGAEVRELIRDTKVESIARELEEKLPE
jgi:uncharacterized membrane protein